APAVRPEEWASPGRPRRILPYQSVDPIDRCDRSQSWMSAARRSSPPQNHTKCVRECTALRARLMNGMTQKIRRRGMLFEQKLVVYERIVAIYDPAALVESAFRIEITGTRR